MTKFTRKSLCCSLFLLKLPFRGPATLLKKTPTQMLPCEICKLSEFTNFQNNYLEEHLWMSASKLYLKRDSSKGFFSWILWIIQEHLFCRVSTNGWFLNTSAGVSLQSSCKPDNLKAFNSIRNRNSHRRCCMGKVVLRNLAKFTWKTCPRVSFLIKLQAWGLGLGEGIHKLIQFYVVMEIRWKLHCQVVATHAPT